MILRALVSLFLLAAAGGALAEEPPDPALQPAYYLIVAGRKAEAKDLLRQIVARDPGNAAALEALGQVHMALLEPDEAARWFARLSEVRPDEPGPRRRRIEALFLAGRLVDARAEFAALEDTPVAAEVAPARLGLEQEIATRDALHRAHRRAGRAIGLIAAAWAAVVVLLARRTPPPLPGLAQVLLGCVLILLAGCGRPSRPNVLLLSVDTLRADRVGLYGAAIPTPNMDRIGREGLVFDAASAPFGRTTQSVGSILTGLHPLRHGADGLGMQLPDKVTTIAERLRGAGWRTAAFASNLHLAPGAGFEQGFEIFSNPRERWSGNSSAALSREALAWLAAQRGSGAPWFLWVHYLDPHWSYDPPADAARRAGVAPAGPDAPSEIVRRMTPPSGTLVFDAPRQLPEPDIERVVRLYDAEVIATDEAIGTLLDGLEREGLLDSTVVLLTSDHGESLGEHRYWFAHGEYLYDTTLRVPLMLRAPGRVAAGAHAARPVSLMDVTPTLLELAGLDTDPALDGRSLLGADDAAATARVFVHVSDHVLVRAENPRRPVPGREGRWWCLREGTLKFTRIPLADGSFEEELFDTAADPGETRDLARERPADVTRMREALLEQQRRLLAEWQQSGAVEPAPVGDSEALRGLGYAH